MLREDVVARGREREIGWIDKGGATLGSPVTCSPTLIHLTVTVVLSHGGKAGHPSRMWVNRISLHLRILPGRMGDSDCDVFHEEFVPTFPRGVASDVR